MFSLLWTEDVGLVLSKASFHLWISNSLTATEQFIYLAFPLPLSFKVFIRKSHLVPLLFQTILLYHWQKIPNQHWDLTCRSSLKKSYEKCILVDYFRDYQWALFSDEHEPYYIGRWVKANGPWHEWLLSFGGVISLLWDSVSSSV